MNSEPADEELLLIELCRLNINETQKENLLLLAGRVTDWIYFSELANRHGVASLICHNSIKTGIIDLMPPQVSGFLRNAAMLSLARNAALYTMIGEVASVLESEGIRTVFLKGLALEMTVYGNKGLRQMSDADIFLPSGDAMKAYRLLTEKGYSFLPVKSVFHKSIIRYTGKHLPPLVKNGLTVDLHSRLIGKEDEWFNTRFPDICTETETGGARVLVPSPLYHFIFLLHHLNTHEMKNESQFRLYTDLAFLIEKHPDEILNSSLTDLSGKLRMNEILASKLLILRDFRGIILPGWLNVFTERWKNENYRSTFLYFLKNPGTPGHYNKPGFYRKAIADIPGFHRKVIYILGDLFPTLRFMKERYGCRTNLQAILHYPHRLGKIFWLFR